MENYIVYRHIHKKNHKSYVGITNQPAENRWRNGKTYSHCSRFQNAINKYGWDAFHHLIIAKNLSREQAIELERAIILKENLTDPMCGYNLTTGGEHYEHSEESKKKISSYRKSLKGNMPDDMRRAISEGLRGNTIRRVAVSQYDAMTGELIAEYESLSIASEKTGAKPCNISLACEGKIKTSAGFIWRYCHDKEPINLDDHVVKYKAVPVNQLTLDGKFITSYRSIKEASMRTKVDASCITKACRGKVRSAGGFKWEYI